VHTPKGDISAFLLIFYLLRHLRFILLQIKTPFTREPKTSVISAKYCGQLCCPL
jgi:hypothetical protein